jgi:hypothetical protein
MFIPEQSPQNLPARTLGYHINEFNTAFQPLMPCFVGFDMLLDVSGDHLFVVLQAHRLRFYDISFRYFSSRLVWTGNDSAICNCRVSEEMCFELCWCNL